MTAPRVSVLTTGGTIASRVGPGGVSTTGSQARDVLDSAGRRAGVQVTVIDVLCVDSAAMSLAEMDTVREAVAVELRDESVAGVVVLHGTDSLEETAMLLDLVHTDPRPVVLTGAQRTADHPESDGPRNIELALRVAADPTRRDLGVLVAFGTRVLRARGVRKTHTTALDAYTGRPAGHDDATRHVLSNNPIGGVRVDIVALYPGVDAVVIDALRRHGTDGIVLQALGAGNANGSIVDAVRRCTDAGIPVALSTRVQGGSVVVTYGGGGGGADLVRAGAFAAGDLGPAQTRILLCVLIAAGSTSITDEFARVTAR